ncbi:MAG TPA: hypothetical protein VGK67_21730 [Myxococcales bacterium]
MNKALMAAAVLATAFLVSSPAARAQERELTREHDGSLGAFATLGVEYSSIVVADCFFCTGSSVDAGGAYHSARTIDGPDAILDVGGTMAVGQAGGEFLLRARLVFLSPAKGISAFLGYRKYWGKDEFKTFVAADLMVNFMPTVTFGARPGFGVAWDFSPIMGMWAEAAGTFGLGWGRRFGAEFTIGFQARSYLLE